MLSLSSCQCRRCASDLAEDSEARVRWGNMKRVALVSSIQAWKARALAGKALGIIDVNNSTGSSRLGPGPGETCTRAGTGPSPPPTKSDSELELERPTSTVTTPRADTGILVDFELLRSLLRQADAARPS